MECVCVLMLFLASFVFCRLSWLYRFLILYICVNAAVKSRSLLSTFEDESPHLLGLGGEYPEQIEDTPAVVMAAWRRSEQQKQGAEPSRMETHPPFRNKSNDTQTSNQLLLDLHRYQQFTPAAVAELEVGKYKPLCFFCHSASVVSCQGCTFPLCCYRRPLVFFL